MSRVTFEVQPGDVVTFFPDGGALGPIRITQEITPDGSFIMHVTAQYTLGEKQRELLERTIRQVLRRVHVSPG